MKYTDWPTKIWAVTLPTAATDLAAGDQLMFGLYPSSDPLQPLIRITNIICSHGGVHNGNNWKADCVGNGVNAAGFMTTGGALFQVESSTSGGKDILTCKLQCDCDSGPGTGGGACWTATDG